MLSTTEIFPDFNKNVNHKLDAVHSCMFPLFFKLSTSPEIHSIVFNLRRGIFFIFFDHFFLRHRLGSGRPGDQFVGVHKHLCLTHNNKKNEVLHCSALVN